MNTLDQNDLARSAIEEGSATLYRGRVIPIIRGGSGAEGEPGPAEPFLPAPIVPAAPEPAAEQAPAAQDAGWQQYTNDPDFQAYLEQQNAQMFDARLQALVGNQPQGAEGAPQDLNALLDPMGDGFGQNLVTLLHGRDQQILQQLQPVLDFVSSQQTTAQTERLAAPILAADAAQHGDLTPDQNKAAMILADAFTTEHERTYGEGNQRAQQLGLTQALSTIRQLAGTAAAAGRQEGIDQLHAATAGLRVPAAGGGGTPTIVQPPARSPQEVLERHFGPNGMSPLRAA